MDPIKEAARRALTGPSKLTDEEFEANWNAEELGPDPMDEAKRAEWIAHLDWHGHDIEVEVS